MNDSKAVSSGLHESSTWLLYFEMQRWVGLALGSWSSCINVDTGWRNAAGAHDDMKQSRAYFRHAWLGLASRRSCRHRRPPAASHGRHRVHAADGVALHFADMRRAARRRREASRGQRPTFPCAVPVLRSVVMFFPGVCGRRLFLANLEAENALKKNHV